MTTFKPHARWLVTVLCLCAILLASAGFPHPVNAAATTFLVNRNGDLGDADLLSPACDIVLGNVGDQCTLRAALQQATTNNVTTIIEFETPMTISPETPLPVVSGGAVGKITISGEQKGIILDGSLLTAAGTVPAIGLNVTGWNNTIQGITVQNFNYGIVVAGNNNTIGVNDSDSTSANEACTIISNAESSATDLLEAGIYITGSGNRVAGNYIGLTLANAVDANENGILIQGDNNIIGTDGDGVIDSAEANIISGNAASGVYIQGGSSSPKPTGNRVAGNIIGLNVAGTAAIANGTDGVYLALTGANNIIGTNGDGSSGDSAERNIISGNGSNGVYIDSFSNSNRVAGNYIGTNKAGTAAVPNTRNGVLLYHSDFCTIGTNGDGISDTQERNLISGNGFSGVQIYWADDNVVAGNWIGLSGEIQPLGNNDHGINLDVGDNTRIGTNADGLSDVQERNVISGNAENGINHSCKIGVITGSVVAGNYIGTNPDGDLPLPNGHDGIFIFNCGQLNTIGGSSAASRNVISGNTGNGIHLDSSSSILMQNNWIGKGTDPSGFPAGNEGEAGIYIHVSSSVYGDSNNNTITGNVIANNAGDGIQVGEDDADVSVGNLLYNNSFYDNAGMGIDLGAQGSTAVDQDDADTGPNGLQNFPEFYSGDIAYDGLTLELPITFHSHPSTSFDFWFYHSPGL